MFHRREAADRCSGVSALMASAGALLRSCWQAAKRWHRNRQAAAALYALDDRMLKDLALHRSEIESVVRGGSDRRLSQFRLGDGATDDTP